MGEIEIDRRHFSFALGLSAAVLMAPGCALAEDHLAEDHLAEAISRTKEAIDDGNIGIRTFLSPTLQRRSRTPRPRRGKRPMLTPRRAHPSEGRHRRRQKDAAAATKRRRAWYRG